MDTKTVRSPRDTPTLERLLTAAELAEYLGIPIATIYDWRVDGKGPRGRRDRTHDGGRMDFHALVARR